MANSMERMMAAGILVSVALISFTLFWGGLASNPSYTGGYEDLSANPDFVSMNASSTRIYDVGVQFQNQLAGLKSPNPGTIILSLVGLVAFAMFGILVLTLTLPVMLIDIFTSSLNVFGGYISVAALSAGLVMILVIRGAMGLLRDQGIVR